MTIRIQTSIDDCSMESSHGGWWVVSRFADVCRSRWDMRLWDASKERCSGQHEVYLSHDATRVLHLDSGIICVY
eukprot:m.845051 g.845051  ORF g.845051 m.845051 type:complete len:74 (+) comp23476_c0_seq20:850-1071(+)